MHLEITTATLSKHDDDGFIECQEDAFGTDGTDLPRELHHAFGHWARPFDPDVDADGRLGKGCALFSFTEGNRGHALLGADARITVKLPKAGKGSAGVYAGTTEDAATAKVAILYFDSTKNGAAMWLVPHASEDKSSAISIDTSTPGSEQIAIRHGAGMGISIVADGDKNPVAINNKAGDAQVLVNDDGVTVSGSKVAINGAVLIGDPLAATPLVLGPALVTWITGVLLPALAAAAGGPITVAPPGADILSTKAFAT